MPGWSSAVGCWYRPDKDLVHHWSETQSSAEREEARKALIQDGFIFFASKLEFDFYRYALDFVHPSNIELHPKVILIPKQPQYQIREVSWKVDFKFNNNLASSPFTLDFYVETKGFETEGFRIKRALFYWNKVGALLMIKSSKDFNQIHNFFKAQP
jgi:hypothetical protein